MVYTVVLEATAERIESSSLSLGTKQWSRSINGDAVDCKSAAFGHAWFDPRILHQIQWKCGRVGLLHQS
jgi:hypothetical protein